MAGLDRRIHQLETAAGMPDPDAQEAAETRRRRYLELWCELVATMAPQHIDIIEADIDAGHLILWPEGFIGATMAAGNLTRTASTMVLDADNGRLRGPLALPEAVAQIYVDDPHATPLHDCADCGLGIPVGTRRDAPPVRYFDRCPMCNGRVGWYAYDNAHQRGKDVA